MSTGTSQYDFDDRRNTPSSSGEYQSAAPAWPDLRATAHARSRLEAHEAIQLREFGGIGRADPNDRVADSPVERLGPVATRVRVFTDDFRGGAAW